MIGMTTILIVMIFYGLSFHRQTSLRFIVFEFHSHILYRYAANFPNADDESATQSGKPLVQSLTDKEFNDVIGLRVTAAPNLVVFQNMEIVENCDEMKRETETIHVTDIRH